VGDGRPGAFDHHVTHQPLQRSDGLGALMRRFIAAIGGTSWGKVPLSTTEQLQWDLFSVGNPKQELAGHLVRQHQSYYMNNLSPLELAQEAARGVLRLGIGDLANAQVVVATPQSSMRPASTRLLLRLARFHERHYLIRG